MRSLNATRKRAFVLMALEAGDFGRARDFSLLLILSLDYQGVAEILSRQGFVTNLFAQLHGGTLKDGKLSFPFHVGGTIDNPVFAKGK